MNQILFVQDKRKFNSQDTKKIVLFFAVSIIIFGLIFLVQGIYGVYIYNQNKTTQQQPEAEKTKIELSQTDDGNALITVESKTAISELIYYWNSEASRTISQYGRTTIQEKITIPVGENTLTVKTIDSNGEETVKQKVFKLQVDKPIITFPSQVGNNLKILVESKVEISYVTYKWNNVQEQKIDMLTFEDKTRFEKEIPILAGKNTIFVTAVDVYGNVSEKSLEVKGVPIDIAPKIQGENIFFEIISNEAITKVEYTFNGETNVISKEQIEQLGETNKVSYKLKLQEGWNYLKIIATTESGVSNKDNPYIGKCEYKK